jgi:hypothetical protein
MSDYDPNLDDQEAGEQIKNALVKRFGPGVIKILDMY